MIQLIADMCHLENQDISANQMMPYVLEKSLENPPIRLWHVSPIKLRHVSLTYLQKWRCHIEDHLIKIMIFL